MVKKTIQLKSSDSSSQSSSQGSPIAFALLAILIYGCKIVWNDSDDSGRQTHNNADQTRFVADHGNLEVIEPFLRSNNETESFMLQQLTAFSMWDACTRDTKQSILNFWMKFDAEPQTLWEELVLLIWKVHGHSYIDPEKVAGFEYWCNILGPTEKEHGQDEAPAALGWHQDRDENGDSYAIYPVMGCVFYGYPHDYVGGGELEFVPQHQQIADGQDEVTMSGVEPEAIDAVYNRLVFINVTHWHRVAPFERGQRMTFAVNLWNQRPTGLLTYEERTKQRTVTESSM